MDNADSDNTHKEAPPITHSNGISSNNQQSIGL